MFLPLWWILQQRMTYGNVRTVWPLEDSHRSFGRHFSAWGTPSLPCTTIASAMWKVYSSARCTCILPSIQQTLSSGLDASQQLEEDWVRLVSLQHDGLSWTFVRKMKQKSTMHRQSSSQWWIGLLWFGARRLRHWKRWSHKYRSTLSWLQPSTYMPSTLSTRTRR